MKRIYKALPCLLAAAFVLSAACGCKNGVSDMRRRERILHERQLQKESEEQQAIDHIPEEPDPDYLIDPENPECPECPKPEEPDEPEKPHGHRERSFLNDPNYKRPSFEEPAPEPEPEPKPKPVPFPLPHN